MTGRLGGDELHIGDELTVTRDDVQIATGAVRSIEVYGAPGKTTIAVGADLADTVRDGTVGGRVSGCREWVSKSECGAELR